MPNYFHIGKFVASHGPHGDLILQHNLGKATSLPGIETLYIEKGKDNFFPYFISKASQRSADEVLLRLEDINSMEDARKLTPKPVWVIKEDFDRLVKKSAPISLLGYHLVDDGNDLGEIVEVIEQPHQLICSIVHNGHEAMIPVHGDNLVKIDNRNRKVHVIIPEGLLDIYQ